MKVFCEELEEVFCHFPKYHMESGLRDLNEKLEREDIFKLTIQNDSLHQDSNDIDALPYQKSGIKSMMFPH